MRPALRRTRSAALAALVAAAAATGCGPPAGTDPAAHNVVLFLLDAARADHFGSYGYGRDTTPRSDAFAAEATRYDAAIADSAYTFASVAALLSGHPPHRTGLLDPRPLPESLSLLAETARAAGFHTLGYSENPYVTATFRFDQGFEQLEETASFEGFAGRGEAPAVSDSGPAIRRAVERAAADGRPFFLYLHLLRPHNPYAPPTPYAGRFGSTPGDRPLGGTATLLALDRRRDSVPAARLDRIRTLYDENLAYGDALFGELLDALTARELLERSVVILVSDHGEAFREHGRMLHSTTVYEEMIRVPLIVRVPGVPAAVREGPVQLSDLGAALQRFFADGGREPAALARLGRGSGDGDEPPALSWTLPSSSRAAVRSRTHKLVLEPSEPRAIDLFDLVADPAEQRTVEAGAVSRSLLDVFEAARASEPAPGSAPADGDVDEGTRRLLRALGYVEE